MSTFRAVLAALLTSVLVAAPTAAGARTADGHAEPGQSAPTVLPFPGVPGVDLAALGYDGPPLDEVDPSVDLAALPDDLFARAQQAGARVESLVERRDGLEAAADLLDGVVRELNPRIAEQRRAEAFARDRLERSRERRLAVSRRIRTEQHELGSLQERMVDAAIAAYIRPPDVDTVDAVLNTGATSTAQLAAPVLHEAKFEHDVDLEDHHEVSLATLESRLATLRTHERVVAQHHEATDRRLTAMVQRRDAHSEARSRTRQALVEVGTQIDTWREVLDEVVTAFAGSDRSVVARAQASSAEVPVVVVEGFRVHAALAPRLEALITAARADGIVLHGWGHRSHETQIALRKAHCGPEPEDVWLKPPGQCSPPTAIPGSSMHELGLALDFTHAGASITSRDSPAYQWLAAHAADYGLFNLPSEPWHWSVNGR